MAEPARRAREAKPKRPRRPRRPAVQYVFVDTSEGPEDTAATAEVVSAWLDTLPPG